MNKNIILGIAVVVAATGFLFYFYLYTNAPEAPVVSTETQGASPATTTTSEEKTKTESSGASNQPATLPSFTAQQVASHASRASCYSIINGSVYDLTAWVAKHPGGEEAILSLCGRDGTEAFMAAHKGAPRQTEVLAAFKIGVVAR